jgi:hypothetical protein
MRRKPYLTIGALLYSGAFVLYSVAAVDNVVRRYYLSSHVILYSVMYFDAESDYLLELFHAIEDIYHKHFRFFFKYVDPIA